MTKEETEKIISAYSKGFQYPFGNGNADTCDLDEVARHAELLNEALEKQIAKKPLKIDNIYSIRYTDNYICPTCGDGFTCTGIANYCYHCGQRLEWDIDKIFEEEKETDV